MNFSDIPVTKTVWSVHLLHQSFEAFKKKMKDK